MKMLFLLYVLHGCFFYIFSTFFRHFVSVLLFSIFYLFKVKKMPFDKQHFILFLFSFLLKAPKGAWLLTPVFILYFDKSPTFTSSSVVHFL